MTGNYEDYREFSVGKFDFNSSTISNEGFPGRAYEEPQVNVLPQPRNSHQAKFASQALLSPHQQLSQGMNRPQHNSRYEYPIVTSYLNNDVSQITNSPSENTHALGLLSQKGMGNVGISASEIEGDNGTEFTEQIENENNKIDLECEAQRLDQDQPSLIDDETIFNEEDDGSSSKLKILNHGSVKIKYAASSHRGSEYKGMNAAASQKISEQASVQGSEAQDSVNERENV